MDVVEKKTVVVTVVAIVSVSGFDHDHVSRARKSTPATQADKFSHGVLAERPDMIATFI
jgi:hypothetical protein